LPASIYSSVLKHRIVSLDIPCRKFILDILRVMRMIKEWNMTMRVESEHKE